ncbi:MAG: hypothetical protein O7H40_02750 [Gammaproteobacteria bacterium]|nr:hypothetical protein [Gammaproteobacteria bacterium]
MPGTASNQKSKASEAVYVFGSDLGGTNDKETAAFAVLVHGADASNASGPSGNAYAIPYRDSSRNLLPLEVIKNYVDTLLNYVEENQQITFQVARFGCESEAHDDEAMARLFSKAPKNCQLPGRWTRILDPKQAGRLLVFDPGAHLIEEKWQARLRQYLSLNAPLWNVPSVEIVSVGQARAIVANEAGAKSLGLKHRVFGPNEAYYGKNAQMAAENKAIWYSTHLLSMFDFEITAQPQQIRLMSIATRSGLTVEQLDTQLID